MEDHHGREVEEKHLYILKAVILRREVLEVKIFAETAK